MADTAEVLGSLLAAVRSVVPFGAPSVWELDPAGSLLTPAGGRASQPAPPPCAVADSPLFVSKWALAFTAFVGANLFQFGWSNVCPLGWMLRKLGVPDTPATCAR